MRVNLSFWPQSAATIHTNKFTAMCSIFDRSRNCSYYKGCPLNFSYICAPVIPPLSRRTCSISTLSLRPLTLSSGVCQSSDNADTSAPASRSFRTQENWPLAAAQCSGVHSHGVLIEGSVPRSRKNVTSSTWPPAAATYSGDSPFLFKAFGTPFPCRSRALRAVTGLAMFIVETADNLAFDMFLIKVC